MDSGADLFRANLPLIDRVIGRVCAKGRLFGADAEDFGRRQPWALAAASVAAGFAASRFLKASSRQRYQARAGGGGRTVGRPAGVYAGAGGRSNGAPESTPPPRAGGIGAGMPGAQAGAMAVSPSGPAV